MYLIELDKNNIAMSIAEVLNILKPKKYSIVDNYLIITGFDFILERKIKKVNLGLTKTIKEIISTSATIDELKIELFKTNISKYYKDNFKVECSGFGEKNFIVAKTIGSIVFKQLKRPKVNVKNPKTLFSCTKTNTRIFFSLLLWKNKDDLRERENKELPETMPTTISPKLSKAIINLSGITKGKLIDPFCGAGGILIEAARMGFKVEGYDIDKRAIGKAKLNLLHLGIKNVKLEMKDALNLNKKCDVIVTDLPYGKNSKISTDLEKLYSTFFNIAAKYCKRMIVGMSAATNKNVISNKWEIVDFFELYVHKSMSKRFYVLEKA